MKASANVIVAGAGPAGCAAACLLARAGQRVLLVERGDVPHPRLCTHAIMPSGLPVLDTMGVTAAVEAAGAQRWYGVRLSLNGVAVEAPLPDGWATHGHGLSLRRHLLDPILLDAVRREPLATVRTGCSVEALVGSDGVVTGARLRDRSGHDEQVQARLVVLAAGRHSRLVTASGLPDRQLPNRHVALIAYLAGVPKENRPYIEGFYDHGRSASLLPADHGLRVAGVMVEPGRWPRRCRPEMMMAELRRFPALRDRLRHACLVSAPVPVRGLRNMLRPVTRPGLALVGDAAMQTDPAFGQGIAWALRSGARLAGEAAAALQVSTGPITLPPRWGWEPAMPPLALGISAFSAIPPGSRLEQWLVRSAAASPRTSAAVLRLISGFAARPASASRLSVAASWTGHTFAV